jgi:protein-glucosylgalactosylhydroxylysine glucosidase
MFGEPATPHRAASVAGSLLLLFAVSLAAQDSTFIVSTTDPTYRAPAFIGNGAFSLVSTPLGATASLSYASGVYDHGPGDVPRIAALPVWNAIDVSDGQHWLGQATLDSTSLRNYHQTLDMYEGVLRTSYEWLHGDRHTAVSVEAFVSRADARLAVVNLALLPHDSGTVTLSFPLRPRPAPHRLALAKLEHTEPDWTLEKVWYPGYVKVESRGATASEVWLAGGTEGRGTPVAFSVRVAWPAREQPLSVRPLVSDSGVALGLTFRTTPDVPITVAKYIGLARSRAAASAATRAALAAGYTATLETHRAAWRRLWQTDIVVDGDPELQRVLHAMQFYLMASIREGTSESIPPMGLSTAGYYGHVFWDADTWMFPALLVLHPDLARSMVMFRHRALPAAERNARTNGYRGAMYPWESDELGVETTPRFAWQNALYENHITGDVALAQWQYYLATGDSAWLARYGEPVLRATANFWASRATFNTVKQRYDITHIVSVDEGLIGIGNDTYTNAVARKNLQLAILASSRLGRAPDTLWGRVAARLYIPYDSAGQYHPTYEGAPEAKRGSVVPLLAFPLGLPMSDTAKRNDIESAIRLMIKEGGGAMMTETLYPVIAAELGERALVDTLLPLSYEGHVRPPFYALAETPRNDAVNFLTGAGGFLQQVIYGYTGLRITDEGLRPVYRPVLPSAITRLMLKHVSVRGKTFDIVVQGDSARFLPR